ncbi:MAG: hypothetical protein IKQ40_04600, partial [Lachnospiraceae bacterium]|nr:hypothetical protein [Lachnospiraceae bacterium]
MGHRNYFKRGISFLARNGLRETLNKGAERIARDRLETDYVPYHADEEELAYQRSHTFAKPYRFSILVPVHETAPDIFAKMLQSVGDQTYGNWELILADSSADETLKGVVLDFTQQYSIRCRD